MTDRYSARSVELAQQLKEKALSRFPLKCKWCDEPIVKRSSFGEDYYRHVSDHTALCEFEFQANEVEPAMTTAPELAAVRQINNALPFAEPIALAEDETGS